MLVLGMANFDMKLFDRALIEKFEIPTDRSPVEWDPKSHSWKSEFERDWEPWLNSDLILDLCTLLNQSEFLQYDWFLLVGSHEDEFDVDGSEVGCAATSIPETVHFSAKYGPTVYWSGTIVFCAKHRDDLALAKLKYSC